MYCYSSVFELGPFSLCPNATGSAELQHQCITAKTHQTAQASSFSLVLSPLSHLKRATQLQTPQNSLYLTRVPYESRESCLQKYTLPCFNAEPPMLWMLEKGRTEARPGEDDDSVDRPTPQKKKIAAQCYRTWGKLAKDECPDSFPLSSAALLHSTILISRFCASKTLCLAEIYIARPDIVLPPAI